MVISRKKFDAVVITKPYNHLIRNWHLFIARFPFSGVARKKMGRKVLKIYSVRKKLKERIG